MQLTDRLPGIRFQAEVPQPDATLPRMDIAALVGFATGGPMHLPVPVEDAGRFRDLFGEDPQLAWNREHARFEAAYLGSSVESFFRNGGRRCWIVRIGNEAEAHRHRFELPGLVEINSVAFPSGSSTVLAFARAPGSWADDLNVLTLLNRERLAFRRTSASPIDLPLVMNGVWSIDLSSAPADLTVGDLLEASLDHGAFRAFLPVESVTNTPVGPRVEGTRAFWYARSSPDDVPTDPITLAEGQAAFADWAAGPDPLKTLAVRRLSFDLLVYRGDELSHRLGGLAFCDDHPRYWANLPSDERLFRLPAGRRDETIPSGLAKLWEEADSPRFPLAGYEGDKSPASGLALPVGMAGAIDLERLSSPQPYGSTKLERDGLSTFNADLFVDERLTRSGQLALRSQAEHIYYVLQQPLRGIHALLPVEEATLVGVPDAVHRAWTRTAVQGTELLEAPELDPIPDPDEYGRYELTWSKIQGATSYRLEGSLDPDFRSYEILHQPETEAVAVSLPRECPERWSFRVRALRFGRISPWSRSRARRIPPSAFFDCDVVRLPNVLLEFVASPPDGRLVWAPLDSSYPTEILDASPPVLHYIVQASSDLDFVAADTLFSGDAREVEITRPSDSPRYFRVRAEVDGALGPWSNTFVINPNQLTDQTLVPESQYDSSDLLAVHVALARFCAARAELIAVLTLPRHYRREEALGHVASLNSDDDAGGSAQYWGSGSFSVPSLTFGESDALDFATLYHPWVATARATPSATFLPPDGAVLGLMAARAMELGAWAAPANDPLEATVALDPRFTTEERTALEIAQINVILQDPRGFLLLSATTLSLEAERRPIHVRRLLILLRRLALREGTTAVFEPNDADFRSFTRHRFERILNGLFVRGALAGATPDAAYQVVTDSDVNPRQSLDLGRFIVELRVAPSRALAFMTVRMVQTGPENLVVTEG